MQFFGEQCSVAPLTRVDVNARPKADRVSWGSIASNDGHIVALKADCLVQQGPSVDDPDSVSLACCDCDVLMATAGIVWGCPGLLD